MKSIKKELLHEKTQTYLWSQVIDFNYYYTYSNNILYELENSIIIKAIRDKIKNNRYTSYIINIYRPRG